MPAAGVTLEGPIIKDKLSYLVSARRSWLDFFDNLFSEDNRMNHSTYDYNAKLSYNLSPKSTLRLMAYGAQDGYHLPYDESGDKQTILRFLDPLPADKFRTDRQPTNYRLDAGYSYRKDFGKNRLLLLRLGLYNIAGNPSEEEILSYYSVHWYRNCLPYASVSFKF